MSTRWHTMSEKQLSILIQGRNYARGNRQIIRIPRAFACISAGAPWLWCSAMQIDKFCRNLHDCACSQHHFTELFFHWKFIGSQMHADADADEDTDTDAIALKRGGGGSKQQSLHRHLLSVGKFAYGYDEIRSHPTLISAAQRAAALARFPKPPLDPEPELLRSTRDVEYQQCNLSTRSVRNNKCSWN